MLEASKPDKVVMAFAPSACCWDDRPDFLGGVAAEGKARGAFFLYVDAQRTDGPRRRGLVAPPLAMPPTSALDALLAATGPRCKTALMRAALAMLNGCGRRAAVSARGGGAGSPQVDGERWTAKERRAARVTKRAPRGATQATRWCC